MQRGDGTARLGLRRLSPKFITTGPPRSASGRLLPVSPRNRRVVILRFHHVAQYDDPSVASCSGQEAYLTRYIPAFNAVMGPLGGAQTVFAGAVLGGIVGEVDQPWTPPA